jgi:hypothetical protein
MPGHVLELGELDRRSDHRLVRERRPRLRNRLENKVALQNKTH